MKLKLFIKPLVWLGLICYGLFIPVSDLPKTSLLDIPHFDKIVHFGLFFVFSLLLFRPFKKLEMRFLLLAPAVSVLLGAILETTQHFISSSRSSNLLDFFANTAGIAVSVFFYHYFVSEKKWEKYF